MTHREAVSVIRDTQCDRGRAWASLRVDGELSEHEAALLEAHLRSCLDCRAFAAQIESLTSALRSAAWVDRPRALPVPVPDPRTRRGTSLAALAAVVAATAVGVVVGVRHSVEAGGISGKVEAIADSAPLNSAPYGSVAGIPLIADPRASSNDRAAPQAASGQRMP
jgi:anti-sigma factor RsiW